MLNIIYNIITTDFCQTAKADACPGRTSNVWLRGQTLNEGGSLSTNSTTEYGL